MGAILNAIQENYCNWFTVVTAPRICRRAATRNGVTAVSSGIGTVGHGERVRERGGGVGTCDNGLLP